MLLIILLVILIIIYLLIFISLQYRKENNIIKPFLKKLETSFMTDPTTKFWSSNRVAYLFTVFLSNIIIFSAILYYVINSGDLPIIDSSILAIYGLANGIPQVAKVWQKKEEQKVIKNGDMDK